MASYSLSGMLQAEYQYSAAGSGGFMREESGPGYAV
jgi:hypothetical protein